MTKAKMARGLIAGLLVSMALVGWLYQHAYRRVDQRQCQCGQRSECRQGRECERQRRERREFQ